MISASLYWWVTQVYLTISLTGCNCKLQLNAINNVSDAKFEFGTIDVFDLKNVDLAKLQFGEDICHGW